VPLHEVELECARISWVTPSPSGEGRGEGLAEKVNLSSYFQNSLRE